MQAIARVKRVFRDKPGGLVVDYLRLADQLRQALATYTESGGQGNPTFDTAQAIALMLEKHRIACDMLHGFNWGKCRTSEGVPVGGGTRWPRLAADDHWAKPPLPTKRPTEI